MANNLSTINDDVDPETLRQMGFDTSSLASRFKPAEDDRNFAARSNTVSEIPKPYHVAQCGTGTIADDISHHRRMVAAVLLYKVLDDFFASIMLDVEIDIWRLRPLVGDETFKQEVHFRWIDGRDAKAVTNHRINRAEPRPSQRSPFPGKISRFPCMVGNTLDNRAPRWGEKTRRLE